MDRDPLHRPGRAHRVEQQLVLRSCVAVWVLVVHWHEHDRVAVDRDLERLQFAMSQIALIQRNETINERVRILCIIRHCSAAHVLGDQDVAPVIRMDAFVTALTEAAIEGAQSSAPSGVRIKIGTHFDHTAEIAIFLREEEGASKRIPCRTIDPVKVSETTCVNRRQKRDPVIGTRHIQVDSCDVSEIAAVLMSLKEEMPAIIVVRSGATGIMIQNEISVFIRLCESSIAYASELRDQARGILEQIDAFDDQSRSKLR